MEKETEEEGGEAGQSFCCSLRDTKCAKAKRSMSYIYISQMIYCFWSVWALGSFFIIFALALMKWRKKTRRWSDCKCILLSYLNSAQFEVSANSIIYIWLEQCTNHRWVCECCSTGIGSEINTLGWVLGLWFLVDPLIRMGFVNEHFCRLCFFFLGRMNVLSFMWWHIKNSPFGWIINLPSKQSQFIACAHNFLITLAVCVCERENMIYGAHKLFYSMKTVRFCFLSI